jgi:nucleoside-diphosphate-sugar epimerase
MNYLSGTRILITGGAGFIGSFITDQLLNEGVEEIIIVDNLLRGSKKNIETALFSNRVKLIVGDIRDGKLIDEIFDSIDYCFHMAALRINHCASEPKQAFDVMFKGTYNVIEACVKHKVKKIVAASSASIYGTADSYPTNESHHPYNNRTLYGVGKIASEGMFRAYNEMYGLDYNAMRYFNVYGPRMDVHGKYTEVLIRWYYMINEGQRPLIYGDGSQTMDFIYVDDVARANILALKSNVTDNAFNVASGIETSLAELCWLLLKVMGSNLEPKHIAIPDERKKVEVIRRLADIREAKEKIGFVSEVPLMEGLQKLVQWLDNQIMNLPRGTLKNITPSSLRYNDGIRNSYLESIHRSKQREIQI